jgi:chemotaxis protein MotB
LLVLVIAAAAGATYWGLAQYKLEQTKYVEEREELDQLRKQNQQLDDRVREKSAELGRAQVKSSSNRERFSQNPEEADAFAAELSAIVGAERSSVRIDGDKIVLQIMDTALFQEAAAKLSVEGQKILDKVGDILVERRDKDVWVEGHTSDQPVAEVAKGFETNWEFTAARALAVVRYFHGEVGIPPERLGASALAEHRPVSRNDKSKNRRIDLVLIPRELRRVED